MIAGILVFLLACMPMSNTLEAGWWEDLTNYFNPPAEAAPPMIKVLIAHDKIGTVLEVKGKYRIYDPHTGEHISTRFAGKRKFIQALSDGLKWGEEFPGIHQILIVPENQTITTLVDGIEYRGSIYVYDIGGTISVVNETYVEDYLESTLTLKYRESWPEEAFAAIAIAARTDAYYQIANPKSKFWEVDASEVGYHGYAVTHQSRGMEKAIQDTRYMILSKNSTSGITPIASQWSLARISLPKAVEMANQGDHAALILSRAFPNTKIELMRFAAIASNHVMR